jgi:hypothetical protein
MPMVKDSAPDMVTSVRIGTRGGKISDYRLLHHEEDAQKMRTFWCIFAWFLESRVQTSEWKWDLLSPSLLKQSTTRLDKYTWERRTKLELLEIWSYFLDELHKRGEEIEARDAWFQRGIFSKVAVRTRGKGEKKKKRKKIVKPTLIVKITETSITQIEQRDWVNSAGSSQYFLKNPTFSRNYAGIFRENTGISGKKNKRGEKRRKFVWKREP